MGSVGWCSGGIFPEKVLEASLGPMPATSKTDLLLAKAKPISNSGSASGIIYLERGGNAALHMEKGERSENMREKQLCRHRGQ